MNRELKEAVAIVELDQSKQTSFTPSTLSDEQIQAIRDYGYPDSFSILFYRQSDANNQVQDIRLETRVMLVLITPIILSCWKTQTSFCQKTSLSPKNRAFRSYF